MPVGTSSPPPPPAPAGKRPARSKPSNKFTGHAVEIAAGAVQACARTNDGNIRCWGNDVLVPRVEPHLDGKATSLSMGFDGKCMKRSDSPHVTCIGVTFVEPATVDGIFAVPQLEGAERIDVGDGDGCAFWADGLARCWGRGPAVGLTGREGLAPRDLTALSGVKAAALRNDFGCVLLEDGSVQCLGNNNAGQLGMAGLQFRKGPVPVKGLPKITAIDVGMMHVCALDHSGAVWCWGANHAGHLAREHDEFSAAPLPIKGMTQVKQLALGDHHACALKEDGQVWCWGWNNTGQLGRGHTSDHEFEPAPVVELEGVQQIASGMKFTCALVSGGDVKCWGDNWLGQLGDGFKQTKSKPTLVKWNKTAPSGSPNPPMAVRELIVEYGKTCAVMVDGSVWCWGKGKAHPERDDSFSGVVSMGTQPFGMTLLQDKRLVLRSGKTIARDVEQLTIGSTHACVRLADKTVRCFGSNFSGALGDGTDLERRGQLIDPGLTGVMQVEVDHATTCALKDGGALWCWGYNGRGTVGNGTFDDQLSPVKASLDNVVKVDAGSEHICAIVKGGRVFCWGWSPALGNDSIKENKGLPVEVPGIERAIDLSAGNNNTCVRLEGGKVMCWGRNYADHRADRELREVPWLAGAKQLRMGLIHACALMGDGSIRCWGENNDGQLGDGTNAPRAKGVTVLWK